MLVTSAISKADFDILMAVIFDHFGTNLSLMPLRLLAVLSRLGRREVGVVLNFFSGMLLPQNSLSSSTFYRGLWTSKV